MGTALHSLPCGARRLLQVVVPLRSLRGCGRYGVDPGIHYPPATDLAGGRSPIVEGDHWSGVAGKTFVTQTHRRTTPHSLDLFKLMYHMRINGDILDHDLLASFDGQHRASVATSLAGDLPDHSWWQATTGVTVGGLGLRTAVTVALPAFVASRILSRPLVVTMVDHLCAAIGASRQTIMAVYDARTDEALSRLASTLPTATALDLLAKLDEAYAECHLSWQNVLSGSEPAMRDQPPPAPRHVRGIAPDDGDGDDEHPHTRKRTKIQGVITAYIDSGVREGLLQMHESEGSWAARMRLAEPGDSSVNHTWLWRLNPRHGSTLEADEYVDSVRFRLGCAGPAEPITCAACNSGILDTGAAHASCCALGEATRGHNAVSSLIHAAAQQCDHTSEMEVPGLIPGTDLRPADILTSALGNAYTALSPGSRPNLSTMAPTWPPFFAKTSLIPQSSGAPTGDLTPTRWPFCALSANPLRANATSLRLRLSFTDCTPASHLRSGDVLHVRFVPAGR